MRNIHFNNTETAEKPEVEPRYNIREVQLSPAEEYRHRPGHTEPISDALAACILHRKGFATATRKGVIVNQKAVGGRVRFWHPESIVCNQMTGEKSDYRVAYVYNGHDPDVIHLLNPNTGAYIESLPAVDKIDVLDAAAAKKKISEHNRVVARAASRLQQLQGDESRQALERAACNGETAQRAVVAMQAMGVETSEASKKRTPAHDLQDANAFAESGRRAISESNTRDRSLEKARERRGIAEFQHDRLPAAEKQTLEESIPDPFA